MGIEASASLIVAAMDLKLVRLLRDAMRSADAAAGPIGMACGGTSPGVAPRRRIEPEARIEPRRVITPEPRIEPRQTIRVESRVVEVAPAPVPLEPEHPCRTHSPIQPPWKVRLWETPVPPAPKIKVVIQRPDIVSKGSLIDLFM